MMTGKFKPALEDAQKSVKLDPSFVKGHLREARCHLVVGDIFSASRSLDAVRQLDPKNAELVKELQNFESLKKQLNQIEQEMVKKDYRSAVFYATRALEIAVHSVKLKLIKSEALCYLKKYDEAINIATDIIRFDNLNVDALYVRGMTLYYQDNIDMAFTHFQQALRLSPDHDKAKELYKKVKAIKNTKEQGNVAFKGNKLDEAFKLYGEALAIDPMNTFTNAKLYFNRAVVSAKVCKAILTKT